jgi:hypothetical protein
LLVELLKLDCDILEFLREGAGSLLLVRPMSIGEDLSLEVKTHRLDLFGDLMALELFHDRLRKGDVIKHGS